MQGDQVYPKSIIVGTRDIMRQFEQETRGLPLKPQDYTEIITQVLDLLLNFGPDACGSYQLLPDVSRLVKNEWDEVADVEELLRLKNASFRLAWAVHNQCEALGFRTFQQPDGTVRRDFPYVVGSWHGGDVVLDHMPF